MGSERANGLWVGPIRIYWHGFSWYLWKPSISDWRPLHQIIAWQWFGLEIDWITDPAFNPAIKQRGGKS